jgi:hypothetical protein
MVLSIDPKVARATMDKVVSVANHQMHPIAQI